MTADTAIQSELDALALHDLAAYLSAAGRVDRLLTLFGDDRRLLRRVDPDLRAWDGYQSDLEVAWAALDRAVAPSSQMGVDDPVPECTRLALVRSTLSAADEIPPALLVAAVTTGHWSADRAVSTVSRYPSPGRRAAGYHRLLGIADLDPDVRQTIRAQVMELAQLPTADLPAWTLLAGLELLDAAGRVAVADRLADAAKLVADWQGGLKLSADGRGLRLSADGRDQEDVPATAVVRAFEQVPESRRPKLVAKVATTLLDNLESSLRSRSAATAEPSPPSTGEPSLLMGQQFEDMVKVMFDPQRARRQTCEALARLAPFLSHHPDPRLFLNRLEGMLPLMAERELRSHLAAQYQAAAADCGLVWNDSSEDEEAVHAGRDDDVLDTEEGHRHDLIRQLLERQGLLREVDDRGGSEAGEDNLFLAPSLSELRRQWLASMLPQQATPEGRDERERNQRSEPGQEGDPVDGDPLPPGLLADLQKLGGPAFIAAFATVNQLPDEVIYGLVREMFNPDELPGQFFMIDFSERKADRASLRGALRTVKGALLTAAITHAFSSGHIATAWQGIPTEYLRDVDFEPVLDEVLAMPTEKQRNSVYESFFSEEAKGVDDIPRLSALALLLPYLDDGQVGRAFTSIVGLHDPAVRRMGLELLAPRLHAGEVAQALRSLDVAADAREQTWLFSELARGLDRTDQRRRQLEAWGKDAVIAMRTGESFGLVAMLLADGTAETSQAAVERPEDAPDLPDAAGLTDALVIAALRAMDANNRVDALLSLASHTKGPFSLEIVDEILALPVINDARKYSWRGYTMALLADRIPEECLPAAYEAAMELPHRLMVGDAQAWGWSWTHEYPRGVVLEALAPRLRGALARSAFEAARELPWAPRDQILRKLAEGADEELARRLFDYSFEVHRSYLDLPDSATPPVPLEDTVVMEPIPVFKIYREVQLAEMIAATAAMLDPQRLDRAVEQALAFNNAGPRAWLPARLLPLVAPEQRDPMLSSAVVAAMEFVHDDPSRLDLITDLLPYMQEEIEGRARPVDAFLALHFPGHAGLLTAEKLGALTETERLEYLQLIGVDGMQELAGRLDETDDEERRRYMVARVLSPFFAENLQLLMVEMLMNAPVDPRLDALDAMRQVLEPPSHQDIVHRTLKQLLEAEMGASERVRRLAGILPFLDPPSRNALVDVAQRIDGPSVDDDDEALGRAMMGVLFSDFGKVLQEDPRYDEWRRNLVARLLQQKLSDDRVNKAIRARRGSRVQLLELLAPELPPAGLERAIGIVLDFPELERADGIAALLPAATGRLKKQLIAAMFGLASPFARLWALFNSQDSLDCIERPELTEFARSTAVAFADPMNVSGCLLMLIGYSGDQRRQWMSWILEAIDTVADDDALKVLSGIAFMAENDTELAGALLDQVCSLSTDTAVHTGVLMLSRRGIDVGVLARDHLPYLQAVASRRLRVLAERGRAELLRTLAGEIGAFTALTTPDGVLQMGRAVRDVCSEWRWP